MGMTRVGTGLGYAGLLLCVVGAAEAARRAPASRADLIHVVAEVTALDPATRGMTLAGPLGGEISATVDASVENLAQVKVGDLVELAYYEAVTLSAQRKGESGALFAGASSPATLDEGPSRAGQQKRATVKVLSVDVGRRLLVVEGANGKLFSTSVERPEFLEKLSTLRSGDELEVVMTKAMVVRITPASSAVEPPVAQAIGTLVVDRGDVVKQVGNTLLIRNERGRMYKVTVDPRFKFLVNGQVRSVYDLWPGIRLLRTSLRVIDVEYVASP